MDNLILDIKINIASKHHMIWYYMWLYDYNFKKYSLTQEGINDFLRYFHYTIKYNGITKHYIFEKLNNILNLPSVITFNRKEWYLNDKKHRLYGPAVIKGKYKEYWINGNKHRDNYPAVIYKGGRMEWYTNGCIYIAISTNVIQKWENESYLYIGKNYTYKNNY